MNKKTLGTLRRMQKMEIKNGIKKINLHNTEKKPLILYMHDIRKIITTKTKRNDNGKEKTYYSYQLNIPGDFLRLIQDNGEYGNKKSYYLMHLLEKHKQHYIIKLAPNGVKSIRTLINVYGSYGAGFHKTFKRKAKLTDEQATNIINIVDSQQVRNEPIIIKEIKDSLNVDEKDARHIYNIYKETESKDKKNIQLTLPKRDMEYLKAYDKCQEIIESINQEIQKENKSLADCNKKPLFKTPTLYAELYFFQHLNIEYMHFEYELHIRIKADIDDAFVNYVKNDKLNPGGIPGWLETLIIDWDDPVVQNLLGISSTIKDYNLHELANEKPVLNLDDFAVDDKQS